MESKSWVTHLEFAVTLVTLLGGFILLDTKFEHRDERMDREFAIQSQRSDRLYEMFIELVKERK